MNVIKYSDVEYLLTARYLSSKISQIDSWPEDVQNGKSNVDALLRFIELYEQLGEMMREYKDLLKLDQQALESVGMTMKLQDLEAAALWK